MKIVAIRGKNLASLEGEFMIDFTVDLCARQVYSPLQAVPEPENQPCWMLCVWLCLTVRHV